MHRRFTVASISAALAVGLIACEAQPEHPVAPDADPSAYQVETIVSGLDLPWGIAFPAPGELLITERSGALRRSIDGALQAGPVPGGPDDIFYGGQGGLLDIALSPDFTETGLVYLSYSAGTEDDNTTALFRARYENGALTGGETVFRAEPMRQTQHHYGGRLAFLPDGTLVLTLGDGFEYREQAQLRDNHLGVVVRLNPDGTAPEDNPFFDESGAAAYVFSYGHRNVQGVAFDRLRGAIWSHEHGPQGGDELNRLAAGGNYGWPIATEGLDYNGARISPFFNHDGFAAPLHVWTPSIAPSGLAVYDSEVHAQWTGDLFVTALAGQALHRLDLDADGAILAEERLLGERTERLRHVRTGPDGALWLLTDSGDGAVLRLTPR